MPKDEEVQKKTKKTPASETIPIQELANFAAQNNIEIEFENDSGSSSSLSPSSSPSTTPTASRKNGGQVKSGSDSGIRLYDPNAPKSTPLNFKTSGKATTEDQFAQLQEQMKAAQAQLQEPGQATKARAEAQAKAEAAKKAQEEQESKNEKEKGKKGKKSKNKKGLKKGQSQKSSKENKEKSPQGSKGSQKDDQKAKGQKSQNKEKEKASQAQKPKEKKPPNPIFAKIGSVVWTLLTKPGTYAIIAVLISVMWLIMTLLQLSLFKVALAGLILGVALVGLSIAGYWFFMTKHGFWNFPAFLVCAALIGCSFYGQRELKSFSNELEAICHPGATFIQSVGLYTPSTVPLNDLNTLNGETVGIMDTRDPVAVNALLDDLLEKDIHVKTKVYNSLQQMYKAVKGQAIRAVILNPAEVKLLEEFLGVGQTGSQLSVAYRLPVNTEVSTPISTKNLEKDSYTVLISGSNSLLKEASYRSNLNLLVTVNPNTHQILTVLLPKSLYVSSSCAEGLACPPPTSPDRISFITYHSIEALRETIENLFESPIDFTVRLDMDKLLLLYDDNETLALSTDTPYTDVNGGNKVLTSSSLIKRFLGNVDDPLADDMNQEMNQLRILLTLSNAYTTISPLDLKKMMPALDLCLSTSFTYDQLCQIVRMFYIFPEPMTQYYQLITGVSSVQYSPTLTEATYMITPDTASLDQARLAVRAVLAGMPPEVNGLPDPSIFNPEPISIPGVDLTPAPASQQESSTAASSQAPEGETGNDEEDENDGNDVNIDIDVYEDEEE